MDSAHPLGGFSGKSSLVVLEGLCHHCMGFPSVCWIEVWLVRLAGWYLGSEDLGEPALFALFLGPGTITAHHRSRIWEIKIFLICFNAFGCK